MAQLRKYPTQACMDHADHDNPYADQTIEEKPRKYGMSL